MADCSGVGAPPSSREAPPRLMVVVDTEEEFDWSAPFDRTRTGVGSIAAQGRGQEILVSYGLVPTYCITYPVAADPAAAAVLRGFRDAGACRIGAHLHPWVTPPYSETVSVFNSYAGNLPPALERAKLAALGEAIATAFGRAPTIYKAGRYGLGPASAATLAALGYTIDLSVMPHSDFRADGGPDFRATPEGPHWLDRPGGIFEMPATRGFCGHAAGQGRRLHALAASRAGQVLHAGGVLARLGVLERVTLSPEGADAAAMIRLLRARHAAGQRAFALTYHSPSLEPGHTPYVRTTADLARFCDTLHAVLDFFFGPFGGLPTDPEALRAEALSRSTR